MAIYPEADLKKLVRVEFPIPNSIPFMHDHGFYRGLPHGEWWIDDFNGEWVSLVRPGYGTKEKYGDGSISIGIHSLSLTATKRDEQQRKTRDDRTIAEAKEIVKRRGGVVEIGG